MSFDWCTHCPYARPTVSRLLTVSCCNHKLKKNLFHNRTGCVSFSLNLFLYDKHYWLLNTNFVSVWRFYSVRPVALCMFASRETRNDYERWKPDLLRRFMDKSHCKIKNEMQSNHIHMAEKTNKMCRQTALRIYAFMSSKLKNTKLTSVVQQTEQWRESKWRRKLKMKVKFISFIRILAEITIWIHHFPARNVKIICSELTLISHAERMSMSMPTP